MSNIKAFLLHALLSIVVVSLLIVLMTTLWYPGSYLKLMGGNRLIYLIAGVDAFLGPIITLIIFNPKNKRMFWDLACILIIQVLAMGYGTYVMFEARPVFTIFYKDAFYVCAQLDIEPKELLKSQKPEFRKLSLTGPKLVAILPPQNTNKLDVIFANLDTAYLYPKLYDDYTNHRKEAIQAGLPLSQLTAINTKNKLNINKLVEKSNQPITNFLYLPITSPLEKMAAIINAKSGELVEIVDVNFTK